MEYFLKQANIRKNEEAGYLEKTKDLTSKLVEFYDCSAKKNYGANRKRRNVLLALSMFLFTGHTKEYMR